MVVFYLNRGEEFTYLESKVLPSLYFLLDGKGEFRILTIMWEMSFLSSNHPLIIFSEGTVIQIRELVIALDSPFLALLLHLILVLVEDYHNLQFAEKN